MAEEEELAGRALAAVFARVDRWAAQHLAANECQSGSRHAQDDEVAHPFPVSHAVQHSLTHALDHLHCLRSVIEKAEELPLAAPFTLMRATLENAASALWLLAPEDRATRVLRRLQFAVADLKDASAVGALGFGVQGPTTEQLRDKIAAVGASAGLDKSHVLGAGAQWVTIVREAGTQVPRGAEHLEATWRLCSGFTHGRSWSAASALDQEEMHEIEPGVWSVQMTAPLRSVAAVTQTAASVFDVGMRLHAKHRLAWREH